MHVYTLSPHILNAAGEMCPFNPKLISLSLSLFAVGNIGSYFPETLIVLIDIHFPFYPITIFLHED